MSGARGSYVQRVCQFPSDLGEHIVIHGSPGKQADLSRLPARTVVDLVPRQRKVRDLVDFIDAHGGRLGAFRGYRVEGKKSDDDEPGSHDPDAVP